jgi:hypothetical protein
MPSVFFIQPKKKFGFRSGCLADGGLPSFVFNGQFFTKLMGKAIEKSAGWSQSKWLRHAENGANGDGRNVEKASS